MADILASVSVVLGAEISGFKAAMADAKRELKGFVQAGEALRNVGSDLTKYVSAPIAAFGGISLAASAKLESLRSGLQAIAQQELGKQGVTGLTAIQQAAEQTGARLVILQNLAKAPGLGLEAAEGADIRLRAVGTAAEESAREIKAFANAIATTGGGKTQFELVTTQLSQMAAKGKVLANDLKPIIESAPAVAGALQKLYGTVDSETISASLTKQGQSSKDFIRILTDELAKLPQVTGGLKAIYENDMDALLVSSAKVGDGLAKALNLQAVGEQLGNQITALGDGFANLSAPTQQFIAVLGLGAAATGPLLVGLGTLGLALPNIKTGFLAVETAVKVLSTGFAALLNPTTLVIAGIAALAGGVYYLATANERAHQSFLDQAAATRQLTTEVSPLLDRYEQLKTKTSLSAQEQEELRVIIEKVAQLMPEAATKIDGYGKVIDIAADKARKFIASNQGITKALALEDLPKQQAKLEKLEKQYANLTRQSEEFNKTGRVTISPGDKTSYGFDELGKTFFADLQANLNATSTALAAQRKELEQTQQSAGVYAGTLRGQLTPALSETELALKFLGGQGKEATGLLAGLHDQLTRLRQEQQDAPTAQLALAYVPLIKNLQDYIARLEGTDKASKKTTDAIAKLRQELARLTALDQLLGDAPNQMQVLERRADTLAKGLKTLVDAGVSTSSRAFRGFAEELVNVSQAFDKLQAKGGTLDLKPVSVKSLIPQTIGDTLSQDVARLLGGYAKQAKPFELPIAAKLNMQAISEAMQPVQLLNKELLKLAGISVKPNWDGFVPKTLNTELLSLGKSLREISGAAQAFGRGFDEAGAKAQALQISIQNLIANGHDPQSKEVKELVKQYQDLSRESQLYQAQASSMQAALSSISSAAESLGNALATGTSGTDSILQGLLNTISAFMAQYGKQLVLIGAGDIAIGNYVKGGLEVAAGLALSLGAGAAKGLGSISSGGGSATTTSPTVTNYGQGSGGTQTIKVVGEFVLRGKNLVAAVRSDDYRSDATD